MVDHSVMPSALQVAQAVSAVLGKKLADQSASEIVLTREEAALCLGLAEACGRESGTGRAGRRLRTQSCLAPSGPAARVR
jgi:hypothetical protein